MAGVRVSARVDVAAGLHESEHVPGPHEAEDLPGAVRQIPADPNHAFVDEIDEMGILPFGDDDDPGGLVGEDSGDVGKLGLFRRREEVAEHRALPVGCPELTGDDLGPPSFTFRAGMPTSDHCSAPRNSPQGTLIPAEPGHAGAVALLPVPEAAAKSDIRQSICCGPLVI